ncbi:putative inactive leucine-rich repeat receptor-like protein kinase IMK2 [Senna tora]|uniref:Putative inactive leucine-rich repeat receptor-like protein kinase IMK2 n=1 Tax=Senna tora TaxID=362788 RepID=A0A834STL3_9FABA|nr:putative inactive leucine-rich repeat receptor-like protein kinase IMK2 [Senna tora]
MAETRWKEVAFEKLEWGFEKLGVRGMRHLGVWDQQELHLGEIPTTLGQLHNLRFFMISNLKNLRLLSISKNFMSGEIPATLGHLHNLKTLYLSYNQLTGANRG